MTSSLAKGVAEAIRGVVRPAGDGFMALHEPFFNGREQDYVAECIATGWVSSVGAFVDRFERELAEFCGVERAVATSNGTSALHVCLLLAGVQPGDEVLIPTLTFVATANAVSYVGAVPHFADSEETTLGLDPEKLAAHLGRIGEMRGGACHNRETGRRIAALVPMHTLGHPADLDALARISRKWSIPMVEDAAESLGSHYHGTHTGGFGLVNAVSFNGNKIITTGGGGAVLTNDGTLADRAKHLTTTAKLPHRWRFEHDMVAYNYRMPNLNAALGVAQLEQLPAFIDAKRALAARYADAFAGMDGVGFVVEPEGCRSNYWLCTLLLDRGREGELEGILEATNDLGLMTRPVWEPMHSLPMFRDCPAMDLSTAVSLAGRLVSIPSGVRLARMT